MKLYLKMGIAAALVALSGLLVIYLAGDGNGRGNLQKRSYFATNGKDSSCLKLSISEHEFYGQYEIKYSQHMKDSGNVSGKLTGDTLKGNFHYLGYGGSMKRMPLALLRREGKLYLGKGLVGTYMNIPCFMPGTPIEYDGAEFIFAEIQESKKNKH